MKKAIIPVLFLFSAASVHSQNAITNSGNLQVHAGASIASFGNFTNTSSAALVNNGTLYIKRDITNNQAAMAAGTGTLHINGSTAEAIGGSQAFRTYNLVSANSSGITLNTNLQVSGTHTFTSGIITTSSTPNYLVYEAGSSYSGNGNTRHVNGWVKKIGSTDFIFPVGNGTIERTVALSDLSASSEFNARYLANTPNPNSTQTPAVWDVHDLEYWPITKVSGGTARVTLNWDYSKVYFPNWIISDILAAGYNGSMWTDNGGAGTATGNVSSTGSVMSNSISSFNLFTLGSRSYILPLTLLGFNAVRVNNYTEVKWTTEKEYNTDYFVVERSDDAVSFYAISQVAARNSANQEQYRIDDHLPLRHIAYYRLRMVDKDGKTNFSRTVAVTDNTNSDLSLLSNPVKSNIVLVASSNLSGDFSYQLSTISGQQVQRGNLAVRGGGQYFITLPAGIPPGTYSLKLANQHRAFYYKVIVQ